MDDEDQMWVPSYMVAANNHNLGNGNIPIFKDPSEIDAANKSSIGGNIYNMVGSAAISGVNSFYNTAVWAGSWFSDEDAKYRDTRDVIAGIDENMAAYYDEHRQAADLIGFIASSVVPGLGGVKVFNAGVKALTAAKEGRMGYNLAKGLGVLPGSRDALVKQAAEAFATTRLPFSYKNPEVMKAIAAGFGQATLESLAFETAAAISLKKSPILDELTFGETLANIGIGGLLGGGIGGVLSGVGTVGRVKKAGREIDRKLSSVTHIFSGEAGTRASDKLLLLRNDLDTMPLVVPEGVSKEVYQSLMTEKIREVENLSLEAMGSLTGGDSELGNLLYLAISHDPTQAYASKLLGLEAVRPIGEGVKLEKKFRTREAKIPKPAKGTVRVYFEPGDSVASTIRGAGKNNYLDVDKAVVSADGKFGLNDAVTGTEILQPTHHKKYLKLWGDSAGMISNDIPAVRHLADLGKITVKKNSVKVGSHAWAIDLKKPFDIAAADYNEALARNIWAMDDTVPKLGSKNVMTVHANDIPTMTKAYREGFTNFQVFDPETGVPLLNKPTKSELLEYLARRKDELAQKEIAADPAKVSIESVANKYDTPVGFLTGEQYSTNLERAIFGLKNEQHKWFVRYHENTPRPPAEDSVKPWMKPQHYEMFYDAKTAEMFDSFQADAMATLTARQEIYRAEAANSAAEILGDKYTLLPDETEADILGLNRAGAGPGFVSFTNAKLGTVAQKFELVGSLVTKWVGEAADKVTNSFTALNYRLLNNPAEADELFTIFQRVRAAGSEQYVFGEDGNLVLRRIMDSTGETPVIIPEHVAEMIPIESDNVRDWLRMHVAMNGARRNNLNTLNAARGTPSEFDARVIYAPQPNPDRFKFHAFVVDDFSITSQGDTTMLYATSAENLERQMAEARAQGFSVYTPRQTANYYKARGLYEHSLSLSESQIDSRLRASGSSAPAFPITGSHQEMIGDIMRWHSQQEGNVIREAVKNKYWKIFGVIGQLGKRYEDQANARIGFRERIKKDIPNPYDSYRKLALGTSLRADYPTWLTLNEFVDDIGTKAWNAVSQIWRSSPSIDDVNRVGEVMNRYGLKLASTEANMQAWANHPAGSKVVTKFIQTQNSVLTTLLLKLDPIHALNNAVSSPILTLTETGSMIRAAFEGNAELAGELAKMLNVPVAGIDDVIRSPTKLLASAYANYFKEGSEELVKKYKNLNIVTSISEQLKYTFELATIKGTETASELEAKRLKLFAAAKKLVDLGERGTGNRVAEEMNRFVSANVMDQLTAPLVKHGLMDEATAGAYINTFVNRTQGNLIASQRPQMFQGAVGQAIGLFQSYQFNIMQQLLRHVAEGSRKDAIMLMGLQGTVYGLNGLPGFTAINDHIIGTASGNKNHTDAYTSINNVVGHSVGEWLTYGVASNMFIHPDLKINLYTRGDINPRRISVVPTNPADIPVYSTYARVFGAVKNSLKSVANGGDVWNALLGGIEQQGVSRPLSGLGRVLRGVTNDGVSFSTSARGNVLGANALYSWANLARLSGAKPFHEAVALDAYYRYQGYESADYARRRSLGLAVRTVIAGGGTPTEEQMNTFTAKYVQSGGKQEEFLQWYNTQVRTASVPQVNQMMKHMEKPAAMYLQNIMGGRLMKTPEEIRMELNQGSE